MANHVIGFAAPALVVGLLVAVVARLLVARGAGLAWWWQAAVNAAAGTAVLIGGLWFFGVDGKMATYAGLVLAIATAQWLCSRGWRT